MADGTSPPEKNERPIAGPKDALEVELLQIWWEILDEDRFGVTDNFFDIGGDSIRAVKLLEEIERRLDRKLPLSSMIDSNTIERQAALLRGEGLAPSWKALVPLRKGDGAPIAFAAAAGGGILVYRPLARYLAADGPIYALQPPGLDGEAPLLLTVEALARHYVEELVAAHPRGPLVLAGYSFGGLVAFEMAQQLTRAGRPVDLVVLLDTHRPTLLRFVERHVSQVISLGVRAGAAYVIEKARGRVAKTANAWRRSRDEQRGRPVRLQGYSNEMQEITDEAGRRYRPRVYGGRVLIVEGDRRCATLWRSLISGRLDVFRVRCPHLELMREPHIRTVARLLSETLGQDRDQRPD